MLSYSERALLTKNPVAKKLFLLMDEKKTNLSFSVDVTTKEKILELVDLVGPEICVLKTHIDIVENFDQDLVEQLQALSQKHNFLIFEDRKFADIGNTVEMQYTKGMYHIADWADIVNAHSVPGPGIIEGLQKGAGGKERALLLLAEMSSAGNLAKGEYTAATIEMAKQYNDFVIGFITMRALVDDGAFINFTPGVKLSAGGDTLKQVYKTPESVILENGSDIIIVGRDIYEVADPVAAAKQYREAGWNAYRARVQK